MEPCSIEQRHRTVLGSNQQHDFRAAQDYGVGAALDQAGNYRCKSGARARFDPTLHQFVVNDAMDQRAIVRLRHDDVQPELALEAPFVEVMLHCECRPQQPDPLDARHPDALGRGISDMQQRNTDRGRNLVGHAMHRVGTEQKEIGAAPLQTLRRLDHQARRIVPPPGVLQRLDFAEVERPHEASR